MFFLGIWPNKLWVHAELCPGEAISIHYRRSWLLVTGVEQTTTNEQLKACERTFRGQEGGERTFQGVGGLGGGRGEVEAHVS